MTFEDLKEKYQDREPAFPLNCPEPNEADLNELIETRNKPFTNTFGMSHLKSTKEFEFVHKNVRINLILRDKILYAIIFITLKTLT